MLILRLCSYTYIILRLCAARTVITVNFICTVWFRVDSAGGMVVPTVYLAEI